MVVLLNAIFEDDESKIEKALGSPEKEQWIAKIDEDLECKSKPQMEKY